jgi:hypothetical protein
MKAGAKPVPDIDLRANGVLLFRRQIERGLSPGECVYAPDNRMEKNDHAIRSYLAGE